MNNLSLLLYLAGVCGALQPALGCLGTIGLVGSCVAKGGSCAEGYRWTMWPYFTLFGVMVFIACLLPSEKTVYMIAASEISGRAVSSPQGQQVLDLLTQKIITGLGK